MVIHDRSQATLLCSFFFYGNKLESAGSIGVWTHLLADAPLNQEADSEVFMFEENLVASQVTSVSTTKRWTMVGSTALQVAIAATLIVIPMLHPERLTLHLQTPLVFTPPPPRPPLPVTQSEPASSETGAIPSVPTTIRPQIPSFTHRTPSDSDAPPRSQTFRTVGAWEHLRSATCSQTRATMESQ